MSGSGLQLELTEGQLRAVLRSALASCKASGHLESLGLSSLEVSTAAERALLAEASDSTLSSGLIRGLLILSAFAEDGSPRATKEVAQELQMNMSTVHRYIRTLAALGLLRAESRLRLYRRASLSLRKGGLAR